MLAERDKGTLIVAKETLLFLLSLEREICCALKV